MTSFAILVSKARQLLSEQIKYLRFVCFEMKRALIFPNPIRGSRFWGALERASFAEIRRPKLQKSPKKNDMMRDLLRISGRMLERAFVI